MKKILILLCAMFAFTAYSQTPSQELAQAFREYKEKKAAELAQQEAETQRLLDNMFNRVYEPVDNTLRPGETEQQRLQRILDPYGIHKSYSAITYFPIIVDRYDDPIMQGIKASERAAEERRERIRNLNPNFSPDQTTIQSTTHSTGPFGNTTSRKSTTITSLGGSSIMIESTTYSTGPFGSGTSKSTTYVW